MAAPSSNMLFSLFISFLLVMLVKKVESQNTSFAIDFFTPHSRLLTYERDAFVPPDTAFVRLVPGDYTPPRASAGRVLYTTPVKLWETRKQASFETTITLRITPYSNSLYYGMTFFVIPVNSTTTTGGNADNLGIYDALKSGSPFFTVEVDGYINSEYDPVYAHVGININSKRSQNHTSHDSLKGKDVTARITYDAPTRKINVVLMYGSGNATVSYAYNLRDLLPQQVQVGLSASTAASTSAAYYDVYTWHFNSTMVDDTNKVLEEDTYIKQYVM